MAKLGSKKSLAAKKKKIKDANTKSVKKIHKKMQKKK